MKKIVILLAILLGGTGMYSPELMARGRNNNTNRTTTPSTTPSSPSRPGSGNNSGSRPNNNYNSGNSRPGGNYNSGNSRPNGNYNSGNSRPGGNYNSSSRPNNHPGYHHDDYNHGGGHNHGGYHPTPPPAHHHHHGGPQYGYVPPRPHMPPHYVYCRPTPPPYWRPVGRIPSFGTILGITLGTAIANTLNPLINSGYVISGYTNNEIYLNNVSFTNLNWPDATMYFTNGILVGSTFAYSSSIYDTSRYNYVYNILMGQYGAPVSIQSLSNGGSSATWWGYDNRYITLSFYPEYNSYGYLRYFTTVSLGN